MDWISNNILHHSKIVRQEKKFLRIKSGFVLEEEMNRSLKHWASFWTRASTRWQTPLVSDWSGFALLLLWCRTVFEDLLLSFTLWKHHLQCSGPQPSFSSVWCRTETGHDYHRLDWQLRRRLCRSQSDGTGPHSPHSLTETSGSTCGLRILLWAKLAKTGPYWLLRPKLSYTEFNFTEGSKNSMAEIYTSLRKQDWGEQSYLH